MTKAKDALDDLNYTVDQAEQSLSFESIETIRKALTLLDKVERGGEDIRDELLDPYCNCNYGEDNYDAGAIHAICAITDKYILIERE